MPLVPLKAKALGIVVFGSYESRNLVNYGGYYFAASYIDISFFAELERSFRLWIDEGNDRAALSVIH